MKILLVLLVLIFPFGELLRFDFGNNIVIKPLDVIAGVTALWWLVLFLRHKPKKSLVKWYHVIFPLCCLLSLVVNSVWLQPLALLASSFYLIRWVSYLGVFFAVAYTDKSFKKKLLVILCIDGVFITLAGFIQYFFYTSLKPLYFLGWDDHMYRLFSVFLDPNFAGAVLVLFFLLIGGLFYKKVTSSQVSNKLQIIIMSLVLLLTMIAIFVTFSRSTLLMLIVGVGVFLVLVHQKRLMIMLLIFMSIFIFLISSHFNVENINLLREASSKARLGNYAVAFHIFQDQPLLGVGFNSYRYAKDKYGIQSGWTKLPSHADAGVDNSFIFILATTGVIGLLAYLFLWFSLLKRALLLHRKEANIFAIIFIASSFGLFVHALFSNSLFFPAILFWMWFLAGQMEQTK